MMRPRGGHLLVPTILLIALAGCSSPDPGPGCPGGWEWTGASCVALLPDGDGVPGDGAPAPLAPGDFEPDELEALAERFQPAQVFAGDAIWPVDVAYCLEGGADLVRHPVDDHERDDGEVVVAAADLAGADLAALPVDGWVYGVDCPGDNLGGGWDDASWFDHWHATQGHDPATAAFPPVHYAHFAWFDRDRALLLAQYWFFYPYDKFANNHEGDWEHVNVVLDVSAEPALVDVHFAFHADSTRELRTITRIADANGGDHPVVFTSGCADLAGWGGCYSGASWPWPGHLSLNIVEDTTPQRRLLHPDDIGVILVPERDDVLAGGWGRELGWVPLPIYLGQWWTQANHPVMLLAEANQSPTPPPYKGSWGRPSSDDWQGEADSEFEHFVAPPGWDVLFNAGHERAVWPEGVEPPP